MERRPCLRGWLAIFDARRSRGLERDIATYKDMRRSHEVSVIKQLDAISQRATGKAILAEILTTRSFSLRIRPFVSWGKDGSNALTAADDRAGATEVGMPKLTSAGKPIKDGGGGTGAGSDVEIDYTAHMWGPYGMAGVSGPGTNSDEYLFHELVHAGRDMKGLRYNLPVNEDYDNEEEFLAVVISNIYLSEKRQTKLRASHYGYTTLEHPERFLDDPELSPSARVLLERFRLRQTSLFNALAGLGPTLTSFNPVRQYKAELDAAHRAVGKGPHGLRVTDHGPRATRSYR